jgi:hypothetical protein
MTSMIESERWGLCLFILAVLCGVAIFAPCAIILPICAQ